MYCSEYDGFKYYHNDPIFHNSIIQGHSEPYPVDYKIVKKYIDMFPHKNRCYIDIGAHIGTTVMPYLKLYNSCVAYEPHQENYSFLCSNIEINKNKLENKNIITKNLCVGDHSMKGKLIYHEGNNSGCYYFEEKEDETVNCIKLDDDLDNIDNIDFIKIDTEGFELSVLRGAKNIILKNKPLIQIETNSLCTKHYGVKVDEIYNYLYDLGALIFDNSQTGNSTYFYFPNDTLCIKEKRIFCFWTGNNPMTENRRRCLESIENCCLITLNNLDTYILQSYPLHEAYKYLSETHKCDYLRTYFMHFYGGGYSDIKQQTGSWCDSFEELLKKNDFFACGYKEIEGGVAAKEFEKHWDQLIGNGAYIFRPNTEFTKKWYDQMIHFLDNKLPLLRENPSSSIRDCHEISNYPIEWNEMLGRIFHPICYEYRDKVIRSLPAPLFTDYL